MNRPNPQATMTGGRGALGQSRTRIAKGSLVNVPAGQEVRIRTQKGYVWSDFAVTGINTSDFQMMMARSREAVFTPTTAQDLANGTRLPCYDFNANFYYPASSMEIGWRDIETTGAVCVVIRNPSGFSDLNVVWYGTETQEVQYIG